MRDRPGLIGESDKSTLFLDEIGELPQPLQARLLRVLDSGGEYSRLGEAKSRRADLRLVAATNRGTDELKHDFAARFTLRLEIPGLNNRRENIPLFVRFLLKRAAEGNPDVAKRYFDADDRKFARARVAPDLMEYLVRHSYTLHMRELEGLLWKAMLSSLDTFIGLTPDVEEQFERSNASAAAKPSDLTADAVAESLDRHEGNITHAARDLRLKNRYVLYRLMKKLGLS
jgi:two-component system nitrogen regulation response regulator GlnG/two-component system response regulator HydG